MEIKINPCPRCGTKVMLKWIAGCDKITARRIHHPYGGKRMWYIRCNCCGYEQTQLSTLTNARGMIREKTTLAEKWNNAKSV